MFDAIIGHKKAISTLSSEIQNNKISHAYLLCGPKYVGKFKILFEFAALLQCEKKSYCKACSSCKLIMKNAHPDAIIIDDLPLEENEEAIKHTNLALEKRKTDTISIADIKEVQRRLSTGTTNPYKICILTDIDRLSLSASNSLLKMLEEPPSEKTLFLLSCENLSSILPTIVSRTRLIKLHTPPITETLAFLKKENAHISHLEEILKFIPSNPGYILSLIHNEEKFETLRETLHEIEDMIHSSDTYQVIALSEKFTKKQEVLNVIEHLEYYLQWMLENKQETLNIKALEQTYQILKNTRKYLKANVSIKNAFLQALLSFHKFTQNI